MQCKAQVLMTPLEGELMRRLTTKIAGTVGALVLGAWPASAQPSDRSTTITFSAPVALPGVTLPAGSYLFKLADSQTNRNIVQVFDEDRTKIFLRPFSRYRLNAMNPLTRP